MSFIINRWVRGEDFFGRTELLTQIAERRGKPTWVLGNRRVGKTSLLRQIEWLCRHNHWSDCLALYWDLQGAGTTEGMKEGFLECLEDAEEVAEELGLDVDELEELSFTACMNKFRRKVKGLSGKHLLLLIDECEELVDVTKEDPGILAPFRKLSQGDFPFTIIMAGSWRMMDLDETDSRTSLFLPDFLPPLLLGPFSEQESVALLQQHGTPQQLARAIYQLSHGNPHLLQIIGEHAARNQNLELALAELKLNKVAQYFFQSNFQCLPETLRQLWGSGKAAQQLQQLDADDARFPYVAHSSLVKREGERNRVNPLLYMVESDWHPDRVVASLGKEVEHDEEPPKPEPPRPKVTPHVEPAPTATTLPERERVDLEEVRRLIEGLRKAGQTPTVVPDTAQGTAATLEDILAFDGDIRSFDQLVREKATRGEVHHILAGATPEYTLGKKSDARTAVYLVGIYWYRLLLGRSHFAEIEDPIERAIALSERDVPIDERVKQEAELDGKAAMILLRCLRARPEQRYANLESLATDLAQL